MFRFRFIIRFILSEDIKDVTGVTGQTVGSGFTLTSWRSRGSWRSQGSRGSHRSRQPVEASLSLGSLHACVNDTVTVRSRFRELFYGQYNCEIGRCSKDDSNSDASRQHD